MLPGRQNTRRNSLPQAVLIVLLLACAPTSPASNSRLTPSAVNTDADQYDGKMVEVYGWVDYGFERRYLLDEEPDEESSAGRLSPSGYDITCVSVEVPEALREKFEHLNRSFVVVRGIFRSDIAGAGIFLGLCNATGLEVASVDPVRTDR